MDDIRAQAERALGFLRQKGGSCYYPYHLEDVRRALQAGIDLGVTQEELGKLKRAGVRALARRYLGDARAGYQTDQSLELFFQELQSIGVRFLDLGAAKEEMLKIITSDVGLPKISQPSRNGSLS